MAFAESQVKALAGKLRARHVKTRISGGKTLSYIEGWRAIDEANRIFGFDGWDRETLESKCIWQSASRGAASCAYTAKVRIRVRANDTTVTRDGSGTGQARGNNPGEAHEIAFKAAETDATKRALATFGNRFGLALYDAEQRGVTSGKAKTKKTVDRPQDSQRQPWTVVSADGEALSTHTEPAEFYAAARKHLRALVDRQEKQRFWQRNQPVVSGLRELLPDLKSEQGRHYSDILVSVYQKSLDQTHPKGAPATPATKGKAVDKSALILSEPRRVRDKDHLKFVASLPCVVCARTPAQAHHIRYAQPRAMSSKVSDEWTVPLCNIHHRALHDSGNEEDWWSVFEINPLEEAERLWGHRTKTSVGGKELAR